MQPTNRLNKLVNATTKLPKGLKSTLLSQVFGKIVPMVGAAKIRYEDLSHAQVIVSLANHKAVQNHIGQIHACAMILLAETATGFVTAMNVPDSAVVLIKNIQVHYKRPTQGAMRAIATLTSEQQQLLQHTEKGETWVSVTVTDESGQAPIQCEMLWAWISKAQLKQKTSA